MNDFIEQNETTEVSYADTLRESIVKASILK